MRTFLASGLATVSLAFFAFLAPASAQQQGGDYTLISPALPTQAPNRIEVVEFFSYACPHCNALNPQLTEWAARLPSDVVFQKVAVGFNKPYYQLMARLFYTLEAIDEEKRLNSAVFRAIHSQGAKLLDEKGVTAWVASQGVDAGKFSAAFNSFSVSSQITRSDKLVERSNLPGVPALVVDGRYLVGGPNIKGGADLLRVTDKLIEKARAERGRK